jgi:hypothetical protein
MEFGVHSIPDVADEVHFPPEVIKVASVRIAVQKYPEWFFSLGSGLLHALSGTSLRERSGAENCQEEQ